jgi:hypothetical protein
LDYGVPEGCDVQDEMCGMLIDDLVIDFFVPGSAKLFVWKESEASGSAL